MFCKTSSEANQYSTISLRAVFQMFALFNSVKSSNKNMTKGKMGRENQKKNKTNTQTKQNKANN